MNPLSSSTIGFFSSVVVLALAMGNAPAVHAAYILGAPTNVGSPVNTTGSDGTPCISSDGLSLYFTSNRAGGSGLHDLWMATRASESAPWSSPVNLGPKVNSSAMDYFPCISADGLSLYFYSTRPGGQGGGDLWVSTRPAADASWIQATNCGSLINSGSEDVSPNLSADGLSLLFSSNRPGGRGDYDLYISTRESRTSPWTTPANLGTSVNTSSLEAAPTLSCDGLTLFFHSIRPGGFGTYDLYLARRVSADQAWSTPMNLGSTINSSYSELGPSLSGNGRFLYFCDHYMNPPRPGGLGTDDIWQVSITPIVDFSGDGIVNLDDLLRLIDSWGQNDPACDIGPTPFGDGIVDAADLEVLMDSWGRVVQDETLMAHWRLDETEGSIAYDSAGNHDGAVIGAPGWQPASGKIDGALLLDGATLIVADTVLNPADGPFSVFAWVKGGSPGQAILSQQGGENWLLSDPDTGALMTELKSGGRTASVLYAGAIIADGVWHHVRFVWDGSNRCLYVDDVPVAEDAQSGLAACDGGLQIGCGKDMESGTFFTGLIDDVRIYNRAVKP